MNPVAERNSEELKSALCSLTMNISDFPPALQRHAVLCLTVIIVLIPPSVLRAQNRTLAPPFATGDTKIEGPSSLEKLDRERANKHPGDVEALREMAVLQVRRGDYTDAIVSYRRVLNLVPADHDAQVGLGRALAFDGQYNPALREFQNLLRAHPGDTDALEGLARVQMWAGRPNEALPICLDLAAHYPANPEYAVDLARVQMRLHHYSEAQRTLTALLAARPYYHDAQLQLAYLELYEGHLAEAFRRFNRLISEDPTDVEALQGNARVAYYRGDLAYAHDLVAKIVADDPRDPAALLLLANLERALHNTGRAKMLVQRAESVDPRDPDVRALDDILRNDTRPTLHTSMSFAREISDANPYNSEDLSAFGYETTYGFFTMPRSESYVSLAYLPSESPSGGIQGAVGPSQVLYRQTTYVTPQLTVRGGVGMARFGPGGPVGIPTEVQPITSAGTRPIGFSGASYVWKKKLTADLTAARTAVTYTPTAVRLGVMEDRLSAGLDYRFNSLTDLRLDPFVTDDFTISYNHVIGLAGSNLAQFHEVDHNRGGGASITFNRKLFHRPTMALDAGYAGLAYGLAGGMERPYMGFFNPGFYQRHYLTAHATGKVHGRLGYDFSAGGGVQQVEHNTPLKPALLLSPAFTFKASPRLLLTLGYTHYDSSQSLGTLRGNAVRLSTDWRF